jgi:hypothetical protein
LNGNNSTVDLAVRFMIFSPVVFLRVSTVCFVIFMLTIL